MARTNWPPCCSLLPFPGVFSRRHSFARFCRGRAVFEFPASRVPPVPSPDMAEKQPQAQAHLPGGYRRLFPPWRQLQQIVHLVAAIHAQQLRQGVALQRNLIFATIQIHLLSPVRKVRPMISLLGPSNKPNHHFNIKGPHRQDCS